MTDWLFLSLLFFGVFLIGALCGALLALWPSRTATRPVHPPGVLVLHRHDIHHHGLPADDLPGDEWKKGPT